MLTKHFRNKDEVGCFHCWEKNDNHHNITSEAGIFRGTLIMEKVKDCVKKIEGRSSLQTWRIVSLGLNAKTGPAETWTRIAGFKVQSANHYTTGPVDKLVGSC